MSNKSRIDLPCVESWATHTGKSLCRTTIQTCKLSGNGRLPLSRLVAFGSGQPLHWSGLDSPRRNLSGKKCRQKIFFLEVEKNTYLLKFLIIPEKRSLALVFTKGGCKQFQGTSILWKWSRPWLSWGKRLFFWCDFCGWFCDQTAGGIPPRGGYNKGIPPQIPPKFRFGN